MGGNGSKGLKWVGVGWGGLRRVEKGCGGVSDLLCHILFSLSVHKYGAARDAADRYLQSVAISGHQWQSVAISGDQWRSVAISGNQWQSVAMRPTDTCTQWQSVAISGHQWQSVAISGD